MRRMEYNPDIPELFIQKPYRWNQEPVHADEIIAPLHRIPAQEPVHADEIIAPVPRMPAQEPVHVDEIIAPVPRIPAQEPVHVDEIIAPVLRMPAQEPVHADEIIAPVQRISFVYNSTGDSAPWIRVRTRPRLEVPLPPLEEMEALVEDEVPALLPIAAPRNDPPVPAPSNCGHDDL
ncbi:uncharacterized protein LOC122505825 [Leptopilina heterotoma]|uniref:uncharacterized protein LOC122505825 n=1 Tax=Leptopilina heterotoma TaxID=63436 RepID=UPI001CA9D755|nr:uncharacterized protein LOC122505825 [Leptopilina heterotoma]